jgi:hypothetical protein
VKLEQEHEGSLRDRSQVNAIDLKKETCTCKELPPTDAKAMWPNPIECILKSGCRRHLNGNPDLLGDYTNAAGTSFLFPDGTD